MNAGRREERRDLWLPALVGLVGALVSLAAWGFMVAERRERILDTARETAAGTSQSIAVALEHQVAALQDLGDLRRLFDLESNDAWEATAGQRLDHVVGLTAVAWIDLDEPRNRIAVGTARESDSQVMGGERVRRGHGTASIEGPEIDSEGDVFYRVFVPVQTRGDHSGFVVGRFRVAPFLEGVLAARARGYAVSVFWSGRKIFSRGTPSADRWQEWWRVEETVGLPLEGGGWRVVHRPTREFAALRLTPFPHYLLATGIVLSVVLAMMAHQIRLIARQSRFLAATNRALDLRRVELESRVAERTEELEDAVKELEAFNYSVSHDLRSPLSAILNFANILEDDYRDRTIDDEGAEILARIRRSATRSIELLEGLLTLSRAGRAALRVERVDMTDLARDTFVQVRAAKGDDADVEFVVDPLPDATGDRQLLGDVFANLFSNALKYSRGCEKRRIRVSGRIDDGECVYEVSDNGNGFDMRFVDKLFGVFERLHAQEDIEGTGVGLAVVARIVKRHGGRVRAQGRPGEGACFAFTLPTRDAS